MKTDTNLLRALYQGYIESRMEIRRKDCPSVRIIVDSFEPSTSRRKKKILIDHISKCSFCREEFMLMMKLQEDSVMTGKRTVEVEGPYSRAKDLGNRSVGLALVWRYACTVLGIGLIVSSLFLPHQEEYSSDAPRSEEIGLSLLHPTSTHTVSNRLVFRWQKNPAIQYYILELFDETLIPIWISPKIIEARVELPPEINSKIRLREYYYWMITAYSDKGKIAESRLARFQLLNSD